MIRGRDFHATGGACQSLGTARLDRGVSKAFPNARSCGTSTKFPLWSCAEPSGRATCSRPSSRHTESPRRHRRRAVPCLSSQLHRTEWSIWRPRGRGKNRPHDAASSVPQLDLGAARDKILAAFRRFGTHLPSELLGVGSRTPSSVKLARPGAPSRITAATPYSRLNFPSSPVVGREWMTRRKAASGVRSTIS